MDSKRASVIYSEFEKKISCEVLDVVRAAKKVIAEIPPEIEHNEQRDMMIKLCKETVERYKSFDLVMQDGTYFSFIRVITDKRTDIGDHTGERSKFASVVFDLAKSTKQLTLSQEQLSDLFITIKKLLSSLSNMKSRLSVVLDPNLPSPAVANRLIDNEVSSLYQSSSPINIKPIDTSDNESPVPKSRGSFSSRGSIDDESKPWKNASPGSNNEPTPLLVTRSRPPPSKTPSDSDIKTFRKSGDGIARSNSALPIVHPGSGGSYISSSPEAQRGYIF